MGTISNRIIASQEAGPLGNTGATSERKVTDWAEVVRQIERNDPAGELTLYRDLSTGARQFFRRRLGTADVEDHVHNSFLAIVAAIRAGALREPERLMGFVRTILYRQVNAEIERAGKLRTHSVACEEAGLLVAPAPDPETAAIREQRATMMRTVLREMSSRDVEILTRCFLHGETAEEVRAAMGLTETQYNLLKSRAKSRLMVMLNQRLRAGKS